MHTTVLINELGMVLGINWFKTLNTINLALMTLGIDSIKTNNLFKLLLFNYLQKIGLKIDWPEQNSTFKTSTEKVQRFNPPFRKASVIKLLFKQSESYGNEQSFSSSQWNLCISFHAVYTCLLYDALKFVMSKRTYFKNNGNP